MTTTMTLDASAASTVAPAVPGRVLLSGVSKIYGKTYAVENLDLDVQAGEFISLLGPSGCGKTTTLRMIGGFEYPDAGTISISDTAVHDLPPHKRPVNTVFQAYALFPHMSVARNVAYGLRFSSVPRSEVGARVSEALAMVRMSHLAERMPAQLSGGQQQRIALARALVKRPAVLLLDEPMSALDRKLREDMQIELKLLQQQLGTTFVFVTHDQEEAMTMSDRIAVMNAGRIEQIGSPSSVYDAPASAFVAGFIGQQNFFTGIVEQSGAGYASTVVEGTPVVSRRTSTTPVAVGSEATFAVRPEHVSLSREPVDGALAATLMSVSRLGASLQAVLLTPGGRKIMARTPGSVEAPAAPGATLYCSWPADQVHVYPGHPPA